MHYTWTDRVKGEQSRPFEVVPPVFVNLVDPVIIFSDDTPKEVSVKIKSASDAPIAGNIRLQFPAGWNASPASIPVSLPSRDEEVTKVFSVLPAKEESKVTLKAVLELPGKTYGHALQTISYDHIPIQTILPQAEANLVRIDIKKEGAVIGYIKGAGDEVPAALRTMGYEVWEMKNEEVTAENLKRVDAVVLGVRALNANERIRFMMTDLLQYVREGGTLVVQYNTNGGLDASAFSPYPLSLSRDRVTEEDAAVRFLKPNHAVLNTPNKITSKDFEGWVQERGLYFPNQWDSHFEAVLSMNDQGEDPLDGSLLIAQYGQGHYVYTGLSFFRELPEGVVGAYKLFANLVSIGKHKTPEHLSVKNKAK
jgi:hypothetical protein